ncbi:MAG: STAS domain-containing protein [Kiritimatiellia bacterium]
MTTCPLTVRVEDEDHFTLITVEGAVDTSNVEEFRSLIMPRCEMPNSRIILDCANISYMNSRSFALLYRFHYTCESNGGTFLVCCVPLKIEHIITLLGLDTLLKIFPSLEDAREAIAGGGTAAS